MQVVCSYYCIAMLYIRDFKDTVHPFFESDTLAHQELCEETLKPATAEPRLYIYMYIFPGGLGYIYIYIYTHICTYIYIYIHI